MKLFFSIRQLIKIQIVFVAVVHIFSACGDSNSGNAINVVTVLPGNDTVIIDSLTVLINSNPNNDVLYAQRSEIYQRMGKFTKSINDMSRAYQLDTLNVNYYVQLSDKYLQFGKSEKTRELLLKAIKIEENNVHVLYRLANLYFYVQDYKQAVSYIKQAKEADPFYAPLYFTHAMMYKEKGDTLKAIEQLQIAVEREPKYYDAYVLLGALYAGQGDSIALDYYRNALKIIPNSYDANYGIAIYYQSVNKPELAIDIYKKMLTVKDYSYESIYFNLGYIEMIFYGEYVNAIAYFDSVLQIQENYTAAYCNIGFCYEQLKNKKEAKANYNKALEIDPDFNIAKLGLERIK